MPTCMMLMPMEVMTTRSPRWEKWHQAADERHQQGRRMPAAMVAPKMPVSPSAGLAPMASMGMTAAKVTDMMTGRRIPAKRPMPRHCSRVTMPQQKRSELMR